MARLRSSSFEQAAGAVPTRQSRRQQSKELSSPIKPQTRQAPKKQRRTRQTDDTSSDREDGTSNNRSARMRKRNAVNSQNLAPVVEESEVESENEDNELATQSRLSGATAVTSHSVTEIAVIKERSDDLASLLVELHNFSNVLLDTILPRQISKASVENKINEVTKPDSIRARMFQKRVGDLDDLPYGTDNFIMRDLILRVLFDTDTPDTLVHADWRPDEILQKANLAKLARKVLPLQWGSEHVRGNLQMLDDIFPQPFLSSFRTRGSSETGASALVEETFALALDIRTQLLHVILREQSAEDELNPESVFGEIFLEGNSRTMKLRAWDIEWPNKLGEKLPKSLAKQWDDRAKAIRKCFTTNTPNIVDFDLLEKAFPWSDFKVKLAQWIQDRNTEVDNAIAQKGGVIRLSDLLETARADQQAGMPSTSVKHRFVGGTKGALEKLAAWKQGRKSLDAQRQRSERVDDDGLAPLPGDDDNEVDDNEAEQETSRENDAEGGPLPKTAAKRGRPSRRRLIDHQPDASKVAWESEDEDEQAANNNPLFVDSTNPEPTQAQPIVTQDEGFEDDNEAFETRQGGEERAGALRRTLKRKSAASLNKRDQPRNVPSGSEDTYDMDDDPPREAAMRAGGKGRADNVTTSPNKRRRTGDQQGGDYEQSGGDDARNGQDEAPEYPEDGPPSTNYANVQSSARIVSEQYTLQTKKPQTRTPWSHEEINAFILLIEKYGPSYALIKAKDKDEYLSIRDQYALKDKARNMKVDYLLARVPLPQNFELIKLDKKAIERLRSRGIAYEQDATRTVRRNQSED